MTRFFVCFIAIALVGASQRRSSLADKIPDDAIIYVAWAESDALADPYKQLRLKGVVDHSTSPRSSPSFCRRWRIGSDRMSRRRRTRFGRRCW